MPLAATGGQTGVDIARLKAELLGECGPALVGKHHIFPVALVGLGPVQQGQLELRHPLQHVGVDLLAHLGLHLIDDAGVACVALVGVVGDQQVQLGVLLDLDAQLVQALDWGVAGEEVLGPGAEGDDLQVRQAEDAPGDGNEFPDHLGAVLGGADGILGDVGLQVAHAQVIGAVEHAAVGVAAAVDHVAVALGSGDAHGGAVELLDKQGLGGLGAEVAQEDHQGVDAVGLHVGDGGGGVLLVLNGDGALIQPFAVLGHDVLPPLGGQRDGEAVAGYGNDAKLHFRDVLHDVFSFFMFVISV